jgi:hypothetical protein
LQGPNPPDVVVVSYYAGDISASDTSAFITYIKAGGCVLLTPPYNVASGYGILTNSGFGSILAGLYGSAYTPGPTNQMYWGEASGLGSGNYAYPINNLSTNPVINGPFGNLTNLAWGEDASGSCGIITPAGATSISPMYSGGSYGGGGTPIPGMSSVFVDNTYNFMYVADGGWLVGASPINNTSWTAYSYPGLTGPAPQYTPIGRASTGGYYGNNTLYNYPLICNWLAHAAQQAVTNGINASKY